MHTHTHRRILLFSAFTQRAYAEEGESREGKRKKYKERKSERVDQWKTRYTRTVVCVYSNASTQHKRSHHRPGAFVISDLPRDQYDVDFTVAAQPRPTGIPGFCRGRRRAIFIRSYECGYVLIHTFTRKTATSIENKICVHIEKQK